MSTSEADSDDVVPVAIPADLDFTEVNGDAGRVGIIYHPDNSDAWVAADDEYVITEGWP